MRQNTSTVISVQTKKRPESWTSAEPRCRSVIKETPVEHLSKTTKNPAEVNVNFGITIKLADFEFARIDVGTRMPCDPDKVEDCYSAVRDIVENHLDTEVKELKKSLAEKASASKK